MADGSAHGPAGGSAGGSADGSADGSAEGSADGLPAGAGPTRTVVDDAAEHRFEMLVDGEVAAIIVYRVEDGGAYAFMHTATRPSFARQGLASALIADVLARMRAGGHPVLPYCPFVNQYLRTHPEYADLVPGTERSRFGF